VADLLTGLLDKSDLFMTASWETVYMTLVSTLFVLLGGLPLGVLLVATIADKYKGAVTPAF
jgi:ABC-type methionine transport system permease subunit